jgi:gluconokinase
MNTSLDRPDSYGASVVVMGVSGSGKTTLAGSLARAMSAVFIDADEFHPATNVEKMRQGVPLTDADRAPWLARLNATLRDASLRGENVVLACSALRVSYRDAIAHGLPRLRWVFLDGKFETIAARIRARSENSDHYMPESLLKSQFDTLERPHDAIVVDIALPSDAQLACVMASLEPV